MRALRDKAKLILVGDADQLAPVQGGAVFNGLVKPSKRNAFFPGDLPMTTAFSSSGTESEGDDPLAGALVCLSRVHRREASPSAAVLGKLCDAVRDGKADDALALAEAGAESIRFVEKLDDPGIDPSIQAGFRDLANAQSAEDALLALGKISHPLRSQSWPLRCFELELAGGWFAFVRGVASPPDCGGGERLHDRIVQRGRRRRAGKPGALRAEDGTRDVARSRLPQHKAGYASSIHRSQGSEFDEVMIVLPPADARLLTRELLYVAVSRAKRAITLVGDGEALRAAVEQREQFRSGVLDMLANHRGS